MAQKVEKSKGGRPPKYKGDETIALAEEYIKECEDEFVNIMESENEKTGRVKYERQLRVNLPKGEGLALKLEVSRDTLYDWAKKYPKFSNILEKINSLQAERVINRALSGEYNANIAKLLLGKHGYHDKQEVQHSGSILGNLLSEISETNQPLVDDNTRTTRKPKEPKVAD